MVKRREYGRLKNHIKTNITHIRYNVQILIIDYLLHHMVDYFYPYLLQRITSYYLLQPNTNKNLCKQCNKFVLHHVIHIYIYKCK